MKLSQLKIPPSWAEIDPTPEGAKAYLMGTIQQMEELVHRSLNRCILLPQDVQGLTAIMGGGRRARPNYLASNLAARWSCGSHLIELMDSHRRESPKRMYFIVTLVSDRWISFDRYQTIIWLGGMKKIIPEVMRHGGFDGWFGAIETQVLDETMAGLGRVLMPHFHAVAWSIDREFCPTAAAAAMGRTGRLKSFIGAPTVDVTGDVHSSPCNFGAYIGKAPAIAKARIPSTRTSSGFEFIDAALPPVAAARLTEVLSGIYLDELLLSGGDGIPIRTAIKRHLTAIVRPHSVDNIATGQAQRYWDRLRPRSSLKRYPPVRIEREFGQLPLNSPICLATGPFTIPVLQTIDAARQVAQQQLPIGHV